MTTAELVEALRSLSADERRSLALALLRGVEQEDRGRTPTRDVPSGGTPPWPVFSSAVLAGQSAEAFDHRTYRAERIEELVERALVAHRG